jgi:hypothetical protein
MRSRRRRPAAPERVFWRIAQIRAGDLREGDIAKLGRDAPTWREVLDVYDQDRDPADTYTPDSGEWRTVTMQVVNGCGRIGVRVLVEEKSTDAEIEDRLLILRALDLVDVQVPVGPEAR